MQRRHFMKLTGMLATLPAIKGIAATSEKPAPSGKQLYLLCIQVRLILLACYHNRFEQLWQN